MKIKHLLFTQCLVWILLLSMLCAFSGCSSSSSDINTTIPTAPTTSTPPVVNKIDINELVNAYKEDWVKADSLYKGKVFSFTGKITKYLNARAIVLNDYILCKASLSQPFETIELGKEYAVNQKVCQGWSEIDGCVVFNTQ
ncbi:OB-fold protein [Dehalococcoides mccartyi]|uniref:Lipoprotein n=1 Tax=Dehalococcoides mccartyi (strain VS) TaxID=311424 RepID=D2BG06_DEHMV|nr:hypothetical protein [Dehalococcoides mccartyi]ACZ61256.1 hypothetical protein DhcVS_83 [Dehalococcoides mccartyi VS]